MQNLIVGISVAVSLCALAPVGSAQRRATPLVELWQQGRAAFGVFVPSEAQPGARGPTGAGGAAAAAGGSGAAAGVSAGAGAGAEQGGRRGRGPQGKPVYTAAGGEQLGANPLYDFAFLNLEGAYDSEAVKAIASGLSRGATPDRRTALIVRVPAFHEDAAQARVRLREVFALGADGITFPHVETLDEARQILAAAQAAKIDVWSPSNPKGDKILMMMLEDPGAVAQAAEFANLRGYSLLACGIGSLRGALKGDSAGAEAGVQKVLAQTRRAKLVNMLTASTSDVEQRVKEGFLGILAQGQNADEAIRIGRAAAGRQ